MKLKEIEPTTFQDFMDELRPRLLNIYPIILIVLTAVKVINLYRAYYPNNIDLKDVWFDLAQLIVLWAIWPLGIWFNRKRQRRRELIALVEEHRENTSSIEPADSIDSVETLQQQAVP